MISIGNTIRGQASGILLAAFFVLAAGLSVPVSGSAQSVTAIDAATGGTTAEQDLLARANKATEALIAGRLDEAMQLLNEVIGSNAMAPRVLAASHYHRGIIHQKRGRYNDAAADYTTALWLEELPDNMRARAHYNRGTALDNLGQQARAKQDFDIAISLAPDMAAAYNNRANVLRRMGEYQAAIADYDKSIELGNPLPHLPRYGRASAREALGDIEGARADLREALELAPDYAPAAASLAALPDAPSALSAAAVPEAVTPAAIEDLPVAQSITVEPVQTAMLPPPPALRVAPVPAASSLAPMPAQPAPAQQLALATPARRAPAVPQALTPDGTVNIAQRTRTLSDLPAAETQLITSDAGANEAVRITTASAFPPDPYQPSAAKPAPVPGSWTTTILPAGSREVLSLNDITPISGQSIVTAALRHGTPTQVAAIAAAPAPKAGMDFAGVPAESFRQRQPEMRVRTAAATPAPVSSRRATTAPAGSGFAVQLASFRSEAEAEAAWADARARHGRVLLDREHMIERADIPGKGIYYRLRVGPLAAKNTAAALCSTLKAQGQDCYVSKL